MCHYLNKSDPTPKKKIELTPPPKKISPAKTERNDHVSLKHNESQNPSVLHRHTLVETKQNNKLTKE